LPVHLGHAGLMRSTGLLVVSIAIAIVIGAGSGCQKKFSGAVSQPNPLVNAVETLKDSEPVVIITGDMELKMPTRQGSVMQLARYPLTNAAQFTVVSRDRIKIHVQVEHKWQEWTELDSWSAYLIDDNGHRYSPEHLQRSASQHLVSMWDYETRSVARNRFGDIVRVYDDGYRRRKPLGSLSVFRGQGDFVFYSRDIFTPAIKSLTFVIERRQLAFRFTWCFDRTTAPRCDGRESGGPLAMTPAKPKHTSP